MRAPSWRLTLRGIAVLSWVVATVWFIYDPGFEPLLAFLAGFGSLVASFRAPDSPIGQPKTFAPNTEQRERNRAKMLKKVRAFWIKGVLENSLHGAVLIQLGLEPEPEAVQHPWDLVLRRVGYEDQRILPGATVAEIFEEVARSLLILGEPGSGKTTVVLELGRALIDAAAKDTSLPIPVVFTLASWAQRRLPFAEWLLAELEEKYQVPKELATFWLSSGELLFLLDGLDEVTHHHRDACVESINQFCLEHGPDIAVTSRTAEYQTLTSRLRFSAAVVVQPLTPLQIEQYLHGAGTPLVAVRNALGADPALRELAKSPLMLSVMSLAYHGASGDELNIVGTIAQRRTHIFNAYVRRMLQRRSGGHTYTPDHTIHWLGWLAQDMNRISQRVCLVERMQPLSLATRRSHAIYVAMSGLGLGLLFAAALATLSFSYTTTQAALVFGTAAGLVAALWEAIFGVQRIETAEAIVWSWEDVRTTLRQPVSLVGYLLGGTAAAGLALLLMGLQEGFNRELVAAWLPAAPLIPVATLTVIGLGPARLEETSRPDQGLRTTLIVTSMVAAVLTAFSAIIFSNPGFGLGSTLIFSAGFLGGDAVVQHFTLRALLCLDGCLPFRYVRFLNYAAECILLRKVGGGYIFIHPLLQDYFADLYTEEALPSASKG